VRTHVAADPMNQIDRAGDVGVEHIARILEILIEESLAKTAPGICQEGVDPATIDLFVELVDAFDRREFGLNRLDPAALAAQLVCGVVNFQLVGRDQQIKVMFGAFPRQFEADAGGSAGDNGEFSLAIKHGRSPSWSCRMCLSCRA
jgi:hypothetical protein